MESTFLRHEHCPNCGSRDNLAIYTDHEWCFGCGYQVNYFNHYKLRLEKPLDIPKNQVFLPEDIESYIPAVAENWLRKYELTTTELIKCQVVWSDKRQLLIFPYNDLNNQLVGWQGRYFGNNPDHPKWTGKGDFKKVNRVYSPTLKINNLTENTNNSIIVVCEDIISTVKLSRQYKSTCLFGSFINYNNLINIYNIYKPSQYIIWLDKDKMKESYIYSSELNKLGLNTRVISTDLDPKEYNNNQIKIIINESKTTTS